MDPFYLCSILKIVFRDTLNFYLLNLNSPLKCLSLPLILVRSENQFMKFNKRTHTCGELREVNIGHTVVLNGWVAIRRDLGGVIFIELRDRHGITQVVFEPNIIRKRMSRKKLRSEFVVSIEGKVRKRPEGTENSALPTGRIDVMVDKLIILNQAETPPFPIEDGIDAHEDLRLKYRYWICAEMKCKKSLLRHQMYQITRKYFDANGFVEVETPIL